MEMIVSLATWLQMTMEETDFGQYPKKSKMKLNPIKSSFVWENTSV